MNTIILLLGGRTVLHFVFILVRQNPPWTKPATLKSWTDLSKISNRNLQWIKPDAKRWWSHNRKLLIRLIERGKFCPRGGSLCGYRTCFTLFSTRFKQYRWLRYVHLCLTVCLNSNTCLHLILSVSCCHDTYHRWDWYSPLPNEYILLIYFTVIALWMDMQPSPHSSNRPFWSRNSHALWNSCILIISRWTPLGTEESSAGRWW